MRRRFTRRDFLKSTALGTTAALAAPCVSGAYAAGKLTLGIWDHWVPGANDNMTKLCQQWGEKNKTEIQIDYLTSVGDKDIITATAEAQAGAGHDIMTHRAWQVAVHRQKLEPLDSVMAELEKKAGKANERSPTSSRGMTASGSASRPRPAARSSPAVPGSTFTSSMPGSSWTRSSRSASAIRSSPTLGPGTSIWRARPS
jgi:hypothetical protein